MHNARLLPAALIVLDAKHYHQGHNGGQCSAQPHNTERAKFRHHASRRREDVTSHAGPGLYVPHPLTSGNALKVGPDGKDLDSNPCPYSRASLSHPVCRQSKSQSPDLGKVSGRIDKVRYRPPRAQNGIR